MHRAHPWLGFAAALCVLLAGMSAQAADPPAVVAAKRKLTEAQGEYTRANAALVALNQKAKRELEASPEFKQALAAVREADAKHTAAAKSVLEKLHATPDFQAAMVNRAALQQQRDALRAQPSTTPETMAQAAIDLLKASGTVTSLETQALADDPQVAKLKTAADYAHSRVDAMNKAVPEIMKKDPALPSVVQRLQQANTQVSEASKEVALAKKQQEQADAQKMNDDIEKSRNQMRDVTSFRR